MSIVQKGPQSVVKLFYAVQKRKILEETDDPILYLSASEAARRIRDGELKSEVLVHAYLKRLFPVNKELHAVAQVFEREALAEAKGVDEYLAGVEKGSEEWESLAERKPLLGVPFTFKDSLELRGKICIAGVPRRQKTAPAEEDAAVLKRLRDSGGIVLASTVVPPACVTWECRTKTSGNTATPYDSRSTAGGSSGGEAALISGCGSLIGVGTDLGGSIRCPAALCGIYGLHCTPQSIPTKGHFPKFESDDYAPMWSPGPMCRYVEDLPLLFSIMTKQEIPESLTSHRPEKILHCDGFSPSRTTQNVTRSMFVAYEQAVNYLSGRYNIQPEKYSLPPAEKVQEWHFNFIRVPNGKEIVNALTGEDSFDFKKETLRYFLGRSDMTFAAIRAGSAVQSTVPGATYERLKKESADFGTELRNRLNDNAILVLPSYPSNKYLHTEPMFTAWDSVYTAVFNLAGVPALVCPMGLDARKRPTSVQLVAAPHNEWLLIAVAEHLNERFGGWRPAEPIHSTSSNKRPIQHHQNGKSPLGDTRHNFSAEVAKEN